MQGTIVFWLLAALLVALPLVVVWRALARPRADAAALRSDATNVAVYRDHLREAERDLAAGLIGEDRLAQVRSDIEHRVLEDTAAVPAAAPVPVRPAQRAAWLLVLLIPLASVATYLALGSPHAVGPAATTTAPPPAGHEVTPQQVEQMLAALAARLQRQPDDAAGWTMLGRSYLALDRNDDAVVALRKAAALRPDDPDVLVELADALARTNNQRLAGEPAQLVQRALRVNPQQPKGLAMSGSAAFEAGRYAEAKSTWERLLASMPADSEGARSLQAGIAEATQRLAGSAGTGPAPRADAAPGPEARADAATGPGPGPRADAAPAADTAGTAVAGKVTLSAALASRAAPGDTLFVYARAAEGPRMPLAIVRKTVADLPLTFRLDDATAMSPAQRLSAHPRVVVVARISKTGDAISRSGDLSGESAPVAPGSGSVDVVIDKVQP